MQKVIGKDTNFVCADEHKNAKMPFSEDEKLGIRNFLLAEENTATLIRLAKSLTKNITSITNAEEALEIILIHCNDASTVLNKKLITKEMIFKYLHAHQVQIDFNITKTGLITKTLDFWNTRSDKNNERNDFTSSTTSQLPIGEFSQSFANWFFTKYNENQLTEADFLPDADLLLKIAATDGLEENSCSEASSIVKLLSERREQFNFFFNLNMSDTGIQGRMDIHGMMLVVTCGTLHNAMSRTCVGVFECLFGLLRDPFQDNNWKIKSLRVVLRSQGSAEMPNVNESESMNHVLALPSPQSDEYG